MCHKSKQKWLFVQGLFEELCHIMDYKLLSTHGDEALLLPFVEYV